VADFYFEQLRQAAAGDDLAELEKLAGCGNITSRQRLAVIDQLVRLIRYPGLSHVGTRPVSPSSRPSLTSSVIARRTVIRLTPRSSLKSRSDWIFVSGRSLPDRISSAMYSWIWT
jgi:hypothetical protein